jgi:diacylglycerol kinase (ATP)
MSAPLRLVINPSARNGRVLRDLPAIAEVLTVAGARFRFQQGSSLDHAKAIAAQAAADGEIVVAVGGDGLTGALAAAVAAASPAGLLGLIPAGRGNDTARMLGIPASPADAARNLLTGSARAVDLIGVRAADGAECIVAGSVYMGILSEAGEIANASRLTRGPSGYLIAGARALLAWQPAMFTVRVDGRAAAGTASGTGELACCTVVVANSAYLAAGKKAAPAADMTDGLLDVVIVRQAGKIAFTRAMLKAGRGTHVRLRQVSTDRGATVTLSADRAMSAAADGESLGCAEPLAAGIPLHIRALPAAIRVIVPQPSADGAAA